MWAPGEKIRLGKDVKNLGALSNLTVVKTWSEDGTQGPVYRYTYDSYGRQNSVTVQIEDGQEKMGEVRR